MYYTVAHIEKIKKMKKLLIIIAILGILSSCQEKEIIPLIGATITAISPLTALPHDQIEITGENFKTINTNVVIFSGGRVAKIISQSSTKIIAEVPVEGVLDGPISVQVSQIEKAVSVDNFTLDKSRPVFVSMTPNSGLSGKISTIQGANFSKDISQVQVYFGTIQAQVISSTEYKIVVKVPQGLDDGLSNVTVVVNGVQSNTLPFMSGIIFQDDFNRAEMDWFDNSLLPNPISTDWNVTKGKWQIASQQASAKEDGMMLYQAAGANLVAGGGKSFRIAVDVNLTQPAQTIFSGLIFNAQSAKAYYLLRLSGDGLLQLLSTPDGGSSWPGVFYSNNIGAIAPNFFRLEVFSDTPGVFQVKVTNTVTSVVVLSQTITDANATYNAGSAGLWCFGNLSNFDNLYLILK